MLRASLAVKIAVLIVVVLVIGFGASTIFTIQRERELLLEQNKVNARRFTATLVASIEGAMLQERPDVTRTTLRELKTSTPVEGLTIFRRNGDEAFSLGERSFKNVSRPIHVYRVIPPGVYEKIV